MCVTGERVTRLRSIKKQLVFELSGHKMATAKGANMHNIKVNFFNNGRI